MLIRKKTEQIWMIILVCSLGVCTTACDSGEFPGNGETPANVDLRFAVSIADVPPTRTSAGPELIQGAAFPEGTHTFGMFITGEGGTPLATGSENNMKSILTRAAGLTDTWNHTDKDDLPLFLKAKQGQTVEITGYYPWVAGATAAAVPFDLSGDMTTCKDLLYLSSPAGAQQILGAAPVALTFSHAYCWVTIRLSKLTSSTVSVKSVSLANSYSGMTDRIVNRGSIDPKTGDIVPASGTAGPLKIDCALPVDIPTDGSGTEPYEFNLLVPSFMREDVQGSDIVIYIKTDDNEVLSFPLNRTHLNNAQGNLYGFEKGKHNTYNIVYNNAAMILSLSDWQETVINDQKLGQGMNGAILEEVWFKGDWFFNYDFKKLDGSNHVYHTYLGEVAEGNNGEYLTVPDIDIDANPALADGWQPFLDKNGVGEASSPRLQVAESLGAGGALVPWKDETTGALTARQACAELRDGGYKDWRLPRVGELFLFSYNAPTPLRKNADQLWSGTEHDADQCYSTYLSKYNDIFPKIVSKTKVQLYVRCVRNKNKPKPTI